MQGIDYLVKERKEHTSKHGFNLKRDYKLYYDKNQLRDAAMYCITLDDKYYPEGWGIWFKESIQAKKVRMTPIDFQIEMNAISGSFLAADIDVLLIAENIKAEEVECYHPIEEDPYVPKDLIKAKITQDKSNEYTIELIVNEYNSRFISNISLDAISLAINNSIDIIKNKGGKLITYRPILSQYGLYTNYYENEVIKELGFMRNNFGVYRLKLK